MSEVFINKVKQIIYNNIQDEKFGVHSLASEIGLSRSQILRKVKASTNKSVNCLIREIRLNEALKLLREDNFTAAEIAYKVGFNSPSYFSKCFHDHFGFPPGDAKTKEVNFLNEISEANKSRQKRRNKLKRILIYIIPLFFLLAIYQLYRIKTNKPISIVILPFIDLSANNDKEYLSDGFTEAITLELSKFESLRVISRTSAMSYKGKDIHSKDIANELHADYLLEGSILYDSDSLRVLIQLIDATKKEKHIWQKSYSQKFENILQLVMNLSNEISKEINIAISPNGIVTNNYKVNAKSYNLYLKGRHLWNQQSDKSINTAINFLHESIAIDSSFAPAYVTLAEAYITLNKFINNNDEKPVNRERSRSAIKKALELDNTLGAAFISNGNILGKFDWDWRGMKAMLDKGLQLEPNNAYGHMLLSDYYLVHNNFDMAIKEVLVAEKLDPMNPNIGTWVGVIFCMTNDYERSIKQYQKVLEIFPNYGSALSELGFVQYLNGQKNDSKNTFIKLQEIWGNHEMVKRYKEEPMEDVFRFWLSNVRAGDPKYCSYPILTAQVHMLMDEKQEALAYLEIAYKYRFEYLPTMLFRPEFYKLRMEPRFKKLVEETGIEMSTGLIIKKNNFNFKD